MRYLPALLLLASCQSWGWSDTADALLPDEFTLGNGSGSSALTGEVDTWWEGDEWPFETESESESTFAALTWHIPSVKSDNGMSRETQRNFALLVDHMVAENDLVTASDEVADQEATEEVVKAGPLTLNLREGVAPPPLWTIAVIAILLLLFFLKMRSSPQRRREW